MSTVLFAVQANIRALLRTGSTPRFLGAGFQNPTGSSIHGRAVKRRVKLSGAYLAEFDRALVWAKLPTSKGDVWAQLGTDDAEDEPAEVESGEDLAL
jgi:hypothetical protein